MSEKLEIDVKENELQHCTTCEYEKAVDRAECNACARAWNDSGYIHYIGWEPKR